MAGFGPSSNVSAICLRPGVRQSVAPNICEAGCTAPHAATPAAMPAAAGNAMDHGLTRIAAAKQRSAAWRAEFRSSWRLTSHSKRYSRTMANQWPDELLETFPRLAASKQQSSQHAKLANLVELAARQAGITQ